jgi:hypothetical protein
MQRVSHDKRWCLAGRVLSARMQILGFTESDPTAQSMIVAFRGALPTLGWTAFIGVSFGVQF